MGSESTKSFHNGLHNLQLFYALIHLSIFSNFSFRAKIIGRTTKFCASAVYNCSINCTNPRDDKTGAACYVKSYLSNLNQGLPICSEADALAGRWVKLYWDTNDDCGEGYDPTFWPGIMKNKTCCSGSQECNAPGAAPPLIKCFSTMSSFSAGYCAGKTAKYSACAVSQRRADEKAAKFAEVGNIRLLTLTLSFKGRFY